jgi:hypothetical protein
MGEWCRKKKRGKEEGEARERGFALGKRRHNYA